MEKEDKRGQGERGKSKFQKIMVRKNIRIPVETPASYKDQKEDEEGPRLGLP